MGVSRTSVHAATSPAHSARLLRRRRIPWLAQLHLACAHVQRWSSEAVLALRLAQLPLARIAGPLRRRSHVGSRCYLARAQRSSSKAALALRVAQLLLAHSARILRRPMGVGLRDFNVSMFYNGVDVVRV